MEVLKTILIVTVMVQICLAMSMPISLNEENINGKLIQETSKEGKHANVEKSLASSSKDQEKPAGYLPQTKDFPTNIPKLPIETPSVSLPDLQQLQRDQLFALAMAQFMRYVQSVVHESELKLPNMLQDIKNIKDMKFENEMLNVENYLRQLDNYKEQAQEFVTKSFAIPEMYENLLKDLESNTMDKFEIKEILQKYNLNNFDETIENYMQLLKQIIDQQINAISKDIAEVAKDSQEGLDKLFKNMLNQNEWKNFMTQISQISM